MATHDKYLHREEVAKIEVGHTDISPRAAWVLIVFFLVSIAAIPTVQIVHDVRAEHETCWGLFAHDVAAARERLADTQASPWLIRRVFNANARLLRGINTFEDDLEDEALLSKLVHAPAQALLTEWGGVGNEKAYLGSGQWVFFRPGIDYVRMAGRAATGPAKGDLRVQRATRQARHQADRHANAGQTDDPPREALRQIRRLQGAAAKPVLRAIQARPGGPRGAGLRRRRGAGKRQAQQRQRPVPRRGHPLAARGHGTGST